MTAPFKTDSEIMNSIGTRVTNLADRMRDDVTSYVGRNNALTGVAFGGAAEQASNLSAQRIAKAAMVADEDLRQIARDIIGSGQDYADMNRTNAAALGSTTV